MGKVISVAKPERRSCKKYNNLKSWSRISEKWKESIVNRCGSTGKFDS